MRMVLKRSMCIVRLLGKSLSAFRSAEQRVYVGGLELVLKAGE